MTTRQYLRDSHEILSAASHKTANIYLHEEAASQFSGLET